MAAPPPVTRTDAVGWLGCENIRKGIASVPAPDSYPHVTCGCPVTGRRPHGVVAAVAPAAPKARHGIDDNTGTLAASEPARRTGPRPAGPRPRCPALLPGIPDDGFPAGHLGGKNIPFTKAGRHDRSAPRRRTTSPVRGREGRGLCTAGTGPCHWPRPGSYSCVGSTSLATGTGRIGPDRSAARSADPLPAMASYPGWAEDRGVASARPALGARTAPGGLVPVVRVLFPAPGRGLDCPGTGPGKAVRAVR